MQQYLVNTTGFALQELAQPNIYPVSPTAQWLSVHVPNEHDKVVLKTTLAADIVRLSGLNIDELHLQDAANPLHPSFYDGTPSYDMVVFRGLVTTNSDGNPALLSDKKKYRLVPIHTEVTTFFVADHALITVQHGNGPDIQTMLPRIKTSASPHELMLRFINQQVDAYLALRQPLTDVLDRWQRELLDPNLRFNDWVALLDARLELRKLESLSEEQFEALGELREAWTEPNALPYSAEQVATLRVRLSDVMEHIERVLNHARRLELSVESAIQLHFASVSHQTNRTVTNLTLMTAVFAPLTLLTGFYGMNVPIPWQEHSNNVWWILAAMLLLEIGTLLVVLWLRRRRQ